MASNTVLKLKASRLSNKELAYSNAAYISPENFEELTRRKAGSDEAGYCSVNGKFIFTIRSSYSVKRNEMGLNAFQRNYGGFEENEILSVSPFSVRDSYLSPCSVVHCTVSSIYNAGCENVEVDANTLERYCKLHCADLVVAKDQLLAAKTVANTALMLQVSKIERAASSSSPGATEGLLVLRGLITPNTRFTFEESKDVSLLLSSGTRQQKNIFSGTFDFQKWGIGGLDKEFLDIFRRAFASRIVSSSIIDELGISHVRGLMLYGPPGTGKTLLARKIGEMLNTRPPKIVNGPEILNKYVGQSEENIRDLFADAEREYKKSKEHSSLHMIIFDEIDAICKRRGASSTSGSVNDGVVNQLLSKIDGVQSLNNILVIGMTNRLDLLDPALLRPGRFEVLVEIGLPDEKGRLDILNIHTRKMRESGRLDPDVDLNYIAAYTKNYSGAELEGLVRSATSYSFEQHINTRDVSKAVDDASIKVIAANFDSALLDIVPGFGAQMEDTDYYSPNGIFKFNDKIDRVFEMLQILGDQLKRSISRRTSSVLLYGPPGCGKTAMSAEIAKLTGFPFIKFINRDMYTQGGEGEVIDGLGRAFDDAYKSELSCIVLDDIENLVDYTAIGPRFSNNILQCLIRFIKKVPPKEGRRLLLVGTTSEFPFLKASGLLKAFMFTYELPLIVSPREIEAVLQERNVAQTLFPTQEKIKIYHWKERPAIGIKQLLLILELAPEISEKPGEITFAAFKDALQRAGYSLEVPLLYSDEGDMVEG